MSSLWLSEGWKMVIAGNVDRDERRKKLVKISTLLTEAWSRLISQYQKGQIILTNEQSLETYFLKNIQNVFQENRLDIPVGRQKEFYGKRVDIWIGDENKSVIELKLFHDKVDWKTTKGITNAVETDLNFAKGDQRIWVGVIDTIPTTPRPEIPFKIPWQECTISKKIFDQYYANINPPSSSPREQKQRWFFVNGLEI